MVRALTLLFFLFGLSGCATWFVTKFSSYDSRSISFETLSLFNQRENSNVSQKSWRGDWLFRRERLELVDRELRSIRPDVMVFQQLMAKKGSPSDSDRNILGSGALGGYAWDVFRVREFEDTGEEQFNAVAIGLPVQLAPIELKSRNWAVGLDGNVSVSVLRLENDPILLFNVEMPTNDRNLGLWYQFLEEKMIEVLKSSPQFCPERLVVAGVLPNGFGASGLSFIEKLELRDVSEGMCEIASDCFTGTPLNELFMATSGNQPPGHMDRIFVHQTAIVASSSVVFRNMESAPRYGSVYGLSRLWPSQRFGWGTSVRLAKCPGS